MFGHGLEEFQGGHHNSTSSNKVSKCQMQMRYNHFLTKKGKFVQRLTPLQKFESPDQTRRVPFSLPKASGSGGSPERAGVGMTTVVTAMRFRRALRKQSSASALERRDGSREWMGQNSKPSPGEHQSRRQMDVHLPHYLCHWLCPMA